MLRGALRAFGLVLAVLVVLVPAAAAQLDEGATPRGFVVPARVVEQPRLQSQLAEVTKVAQQRGASAAVQTARARGLETEQGKIRVVVEGAPDVARTAISRNGGSVTGSAGALTEALVPAAAVGALARATGVRYVRAPFASFPLATDSEGIAASDADDWHGVGQTGAGVKIAVIDGGFAGLAARQTAGELPPLTQIDHCGGSMGAPEDHGTAVAEIVHEMAPAAQLFLICVDSEVDLATAANYVKANGITIVNHSVGWYNTSRGDGSGVAGTPDAIVADARANGVLWINAAGNAAREHWSGTFVDGDADGWAEFAPADETNSFFMPVGATICAFLKWDAWPTTRQDFDIYLVPLAGGEPVAGSINDQQTIALPPTEEFCYLNDTGSSQSFGFVIDRFSATIAPRLDLFVTVDNVLEHQTAAGSVVEPATAPAALAVGAICWQSSALEPYSSRGPTIDGRTKPDLAGPAAVSSAVYGSFTACGSSGFTGTSSSAPHIAGAAALLKGMFPLATVAELQSWLESDALDLAPAGKDTSTGAGKLRLPTTPPPAPTTSVPAPGPEDVTYQSFKVAGATSSGGFTGSYYWEYGPTTAYGSQSPIVTVASPRSGQSAEAVLFGLSPATEYHYRLVAVNPFGSSPGPDRTQTTAPALPPDAETKTPQAIGAQNARLHGLISPHTAATTAKFQWGETTAYGNESTPTAAGTFGTNPVTAEISGLQPNTTYHYRVVAESANGTTNGADLTFTTTASAPPVAVTLPTNDVTTSMAALHAAVDPGGLPTTYYFEWGPAGSFTQQTPNGSAGYGDEPVDASSVLVGLQPGTPYTYRVVATNSLGTSTGGAVTFTTRSNPAPPSGGGGGGGAGNVDLAIEGSAQPATAGVGDDVTYLLKVTDVTGALAQGVKVDVQLPGGSQLTGSSADRGSGCDGAPLVCNLEFLSAQAPVGTIRLQTKVTAAGEQTLKATVRYALTDPKPENNSVTIVVAPKTVVQPPTVKPPAVTSPTTKTGTAGPNTLRGTARPDTLRGLGGNDRLFGRAGTDRLFGDAGHDWLYGEAGSDRLYGGSGNDRLFGGSGRDLFEGGSGSDVISARDRVKDTIRCGAGRDTVTADRVDAVARDCERVTRR